MVFFGNTIPQITGQKSIYFQDTISKQIFSNLEHFIYRGGSRRWSWGLSRLPLDAMRGSLVDLTTGRISRYIFMDFIIK